jgi:nicotinamide-nucleotide amidase
MNAIILSIGDELVLGQTVDTNSAWLSVRLAAVGCAVIAHLTIADDQPAIEQAIRETSVNCQLLIISGGLGPTPDDLTRQALAAVMRRPLEPNAQWMAELERFFAVRKRPMPEANRIQAMIPRSAKMIFNTAGTAAGIETDLGDCRAYVVPGVPKEMKAMFERDIFPFVQSKSDGAVILSQTLHTFGLGESAVAEMLGDLMRRDRNPSVGTTVSNGVVSLRINSRFPDGAQAQREIESTVAACRAALGPLIYGEEDDTLQAIVGAMLTSANGGPTVATAESCTGGLLGKMLTDISGSSAYYRFGWVTYANQAKQELLGVPLETLTEFGAVSEPVVRAMAEGARMRAKSTYALSISGIAGPDGGTPAKPVGTVCIALASPNGTEARAFLFPGDREFIRDRSAKMALTMLRYQLLGVKMPF